MIKRFFKSLKVAGFLSVTSIVRGNLWVTLLTVLILILVSSNLLFVPGLLNGVNIAADTKMKAAYSGDLVIVSTLDSSIITDADALASEIESIPDVEAVTARSIVNARIKSGDSHIDTQVYGIDPVQDEAVFDISEYLVEGSYLSSGDRGQVVLGIEIAGADDADIPLYARSFQTVHTGDEVSITYANGVTRNYTVKGIFYSGLMQTDLQAFVTSAELESVYPALADTASIMNVTIAGRADESTVIDAIRAVNESIKVYTCQDYAGGIISSMTQSFDLIRVILGIVNTLVAGFTIYIITFIDVANRRRQIGIQRAIGITPGSISGSYIMRALFYSLTAVVISGLLFHINNILPSGSGLAFQFPFGPAYVTVAFQDMLNSAYILLGVSVVAALIPVISVLRSKLINTIWG
jgi:putative ABC transport system permease protein